MTNQARWIGALSVLAGYLVTAGSVCSAQTLIDRSASNWKYRKGTVEASDPRTAWRERDFDDSTWSSARAPFGYGVSGLNKTLSDMKNNYSSFFLRHTFTVSSIEPETRLRLEVDYDDGFIVWINGDRVLDKNEPDGKPLHDSLASDYHNSGTYEIYELKDIEDYLDLGENVIAVQVFNQSLGSGDCKIDVALASFKRVADTKFSIDSGFFESSFDLTITTATSGATIRYTTDGRAPTTSYGTARTGQAVIHVSGTRVLRAAAFKSGYEQTDIDTRTYLFLDDVLGQSEMDPDIVDDPRYSGTIKADLKAVPTLSIVGDYRDLMSNEAHPRDWEVPVCAELMLPDGGKGFREDCGIGYAGPPQESPDRWKHQSQYNLYFRSEYGPSKLDYPLFGEDYEVKRFDNLRLRAGMNDHWNRYWSSMYTKAQKVQYARDQWSRMTQDALGGEACRGTYVHLYINGLYRGIYNPAEKPSESFMAAHYGGEKEDYDVVKQYDGVVGGTRTAWDEMVNFAKNHDLSLSGNYATMQDYLDIPQAIDYHIIQFHCSNVDWPVNNWRAGRKTRNRQPGDCKWQLFIWDAEESFDISDTTGVDDYTKLDSGGVENLHGRLKANRDYRMLFADRVYKHFFNGGALSPASGEARYRAICDQIEDALVPESARWGDSIDYWKDNPLNRDDHWRPFRDHLLNDWFPARNGNLLSAFRSRALYPQIDPPSFQRHGGAIGSGFKLTMTNPNGSGTLVYRKDGGDPRAPGGAKASGTSNYSTPFSLSRTTHVQARVRKNDSTWSAVHAATFNYTAHYPLIRITEILYNPLGGGDFEFIEIRNISDSTTVGLSEMTFENGLDYTFAPGAELGPGKFAVLVRNEAAFTARHPDVAGSADVQIFGTYRGALDNSGERLRLVDSDGATVATVRYNDKDPWPEEADGDGFSLVYTGTDDDQDHAAKWRASNLIGGSPGYDEGAAYRVVINEALTHTDLPQLDTIELYNAGDTGVNIGGWYLSDTADNYKLYELPSHLLGAGGYKTYDENVLGFQLDSHGDQVYLTKWDSNDNLLYLAEARFGGAANGIAFGRHVRSDGGADFVAQSSGDTLGSANAYPLVGPVVISELMYHPLEGGDEFIELMNISGSAVPLYDTANPANTWRLDGAVEYTFPTGVTMQAGEIIVVIAGDSRTVFRNKYGVPADVQIFKQYAGLLNNSGESLKVWRPGEPDAKGVPWILVDRVKYNDNSPWPESADGDGPSLERIAPSLYGNDPANWAASLDPDGTPGVENSGVLVAKTAGWKYHDKGENLGTGWRNAGYDDSGWDDGNAPLGYPDTNQDIDTEVDFGDDPADKHITTYFRTRFMLGANPADVTMLKLRARYDDGYVAYLNGQEVARADMPTGTISYNTQASGGGSGTSYEEKNILSHKNELVQGLNVLAVEVHQTGPTSSDIFMDLDLRHTATQSLTVPAAPSNVAAAPLSLSQIRLDWQDNSGNEDQFKVRWGLSAADQPNEVFLPANTTSWTHTGLSADTTYHYKVRAQNAAGVSAYVGPVNATTDDHAPAIAVDTTSIQVSCVVGTDAGDETFQVWNSGGATLQYQVSDNTSKLSVSPTTGSSTGSGNKQTHTVTFTTAALTVGTYDRTITVADNGSGASNGPITIDVEIVVTQSVPAAPSGLAAQALSPTEVRLTWDDLPDETQYMLRTSLDGIDWYAIAQVYPTANTTVYTDSGLTPDTTYHYKLRGINGAGMGPYCTPVSVATPPAVPPAIAVSTTNIAVSCTAGTDAANETFEVWNGGAGTLLYQVSESTSKLSVAPTGGSSTGSGDKQTHAITFTTAGLAAGTYDRTITVADDGSGAANGPIAIAVRITVLEPGPFTAYNDLAWVTGETTANITLFTTGESGVLVDHATGTPTPVTLTVGGGAGPYLTQGAAPNAGTEAHGVFDGKVGLAGLISYAPQDLSLAFTGLNSALRYEVVLFGNRDNPDYTARTATVRLSGTEPGFANKSTPGTTIGTDTDPDDTTVLGNGYNTVNGHVARYTEIDPGADGTFVLTVSDYTSKFYANALMLRATEPAPEQDAVVKGSTWRYRKGTAEASSPAYAWRSGADGFDDSAWDQGAAPFGYGPLSYGTTLDMRNNCASLFLRRTFTMQEPDAVSALALAVDYDDGFILWLNGEEIARVNVQGTPGEPIAHDQTCSGYVSGSSAAYTRTYETAELPALRTNNVVAVQLFNNTLGSSDAMFDLALTVTEHEFAAADDTDGNGLLDVWETASGTTQPAHVDEDGDGLSNYEEWVAGTEPMVHGSWFMVGVGVQDGQIVVSFEALPATGLGYEGLQRRYTLESRAGIGPNAAWSAVPGYADILGQGQTVVYTNTSGAAETVYRARVWLE